MTLAEYKAAQGISLTAMASLLGFPVSTVHGWLTGARKPGIEMLQRLSSATNGVVSPAELRPDLIVILGVGRSELRAASSVPRPKPHCFTDEHDAFLREIDSFLAESGMSATALGRAAVNDGHFVRRLREHRGVTLATVGRVRKYMTVRRAERAAKVSLNLILGRTGLSTAELGQRLGVSAETVRLWRNGQRRMSPSHARRVETEFGIARHELRPDIYDPPVRTRRLPEPMPGVETPSTAKPPGVPA